MTGLDQALESIEADVRALMREAAAQRAGRGEDQRRHRDDTRRLLLSLLQVLDAFARVAAAVDQKPDQVTPQMKIWLGNFRTIRRLVEKIVAEQGVAKIENLDAGFDPAWHTVAEVVADPSREDGAIVREVQPGYTWGGEVLRKSEVVTVRNHE